MSLPVAAWYADPDNPAQIRWWDGQAWSQHVREAPASAAAPASPAAAAPVTPAPAPVPVAPATVAPTPVTLAPVAPLFTAPSAVTPAVEPAAPVVPAPSPSPSPSPSPVPAPSPFEAWAIAPAADTSTTSTPPPMARPAVEPLPPAPPSPFGPLASATPVAPLEPPRPTAKGDAIGDAPSIGAHRLPPLPNSSAPSPASAPTPSLSSPTPSSGIKITEYSAGRKVRLGLIGILVVVLAAGVGVVAMGRLGSVTGGSSQEASAEGLSVVEGTGYRLEIPDDWTKVEDAPEPFDVAFTTPSGATLVVTTEELPEGGNLQDPGAQQKVIDVLVNVVKALSPGAQILSRTPAHIDGLDGELVKRTGTSPTSGVAYEEDAFIVFHGTQLFVLSLGGPTEALNSAPLQTQLPLVVASVRFT